MTQLEAVFYLLESTGFDQCRDTDSPASVRIVDGLAQCIRNFNPDLLTALPQSIDDDSLLEASKCIIDALELMGCPHSVESYQIQKLELGSIYPVVKWLVNDLKAQQTPCRNEVISTIPVEFWKKSVEADSTKRIRSLKLSSELAYESHMQFLLKSRTAYFCTSKKSLSEVTDSASLTENDLIEQDQRKTCIVNELKDLRDRIRLSGADSMVALLLSLKALEREEVNAKSNHDMKKVELEKQTAELEAKASWDSSSLSDDLDRLLGSSMEKLHSSKMELAAILRAVLSAKQQLDDVPSQSELIQYECRLSELNTNIGEKHRQTQKYFATYNAIMEIKELMLKEISLFNSINSQFQDAITNPEGQTKLISSLEGILKGIQQKLEKVQLSLHEDQKTCNTLRERYAASVAEQRHQFTLSKSIQEESTKNARLRAEVAARESLSN